MAKATTIKVSTALSVFSPDIADTDVLTTAIKRLSGENEAAIARSERLFDAAQSIRAQLSQANQRHGIVELLLVQGQHANRIKTFEELASQIREQVRDEESRSVATAVATAKSRRERSSTDRFANESLMVTVHSDALLDRIEQQLRLWRDESANISENLQAKNVTETITLTASVIDALIEAKIVSATS